MCLRTIWTMPAMTLMERLRRTREWAAMEIAAHLPLRIRYWTTMQELARATTDSSNIPATPLEDILRNMDRPKSVA